MPRVPRNKPILRPEQSAMAAVWIVLACIGTIVGVVHVIARCAS